MQYIILKYMIISIYLLSTCPMCVNSFDSRRNMYKKLVIEDHKLCSVVAKRNIELNGYTVDGLIVSRSTTKDHSLDWATHWDCNFTVTSKNGLFAVVQTLNFRRNESTGECIDFVKFETKQRSYHEKLCGDFQIFDSSGLDYFNAVDSYGYIETRVFISRDKWRHNQQMDLKIVYTRYTGCDYGYSPCRNNSNQCINNQFINDSIVNCPYDCFDELNCQTLKERLCENDCHSIIYASSANSTKIILSAVTSLVVSFLVFIVCIWICRKTGKLCFQPNNSQSSTPRQASRTIEMQSRSQETETTSGTQPEVVNEPEKDLPPSYESLFPER